MFSPDITGKKFGRWTALSKAPSSPRGLAKWECVCECGTRRVVDSNRLVNGKSKSCGCARSAATAKAKTVHGGSYTRTYGIWSGMKTRCLNPNEKCYPNYGGRGITVCERWQSFETFLADMGEAPPGATLDRINNDGNYDPSNCRWATLEVQLNNKRSNHRIEIDGVSRTIAEWSRVTGVKESTIMSRLRYGWTKRAAVFDKVRKS